MPEQPGFQLHATVTCPDRSAIAQGATIAGGDLWVTQDQPVGKGQHLIINRLPADGSTPETMRVVDGGHGDLAFDVENVDGVMCPSFVDHDGRLWRIPFQPGETVKLSGQPITRGKLPIRGVDGVTLVRTKNGNRWQYWGPEHPGPGQGTVSGTHAATRHLFSTVGYRWIQGYAYAGGLLYTLRGSPQTPGGFLYPDGHVHPYMEVRQALDHPRGLILPPWPVEHLGRDDNGDPIGGKTECEALFVAMWEGKPHLFVGISTGHHYDASYSLALFRREL